MATKLISNALKDVSAGGLAFLAAGVWTKLGRSAVRVSLPGGGTAMARARQSDFAVLRQVFRDHEYRLPAAVDERANTAYRELLIQGKTPVIVDAGSNIGAAALWFSRSFPDAVVLAIEPDPGNFIALSQNVASCPMVRPVRAAIGCEPGSVVLSSDTMGWAVQTKRGDGGDCRVITVAEAVAGVPNGVLFIAKIDIEGFESDLFARNTEWIDQAAVVFLEPHDWMMPGQRTSRNFQAEFGKRDFELYLQGENLIYSRA